MSKFGQGCFYELGFSKNPLFVIADLIRNLWFTTRLRLGGRNDGTENKKTGKLWIFSNPIYRFYFV